MIEKVCDKCNTKSYIDENSPVRTSTACYVCTMNLANETKSYAISRNGELTYGVRIPKGNTKLTDAFGNRKFAKYDSLDSD